MAPYTIIFSEQAESDIRYWRENSLKTLEKIEKLILDTMAHPASGLGKPERLRHQLSGRWSRRINYTDRMVYSVDEENKVLTVYQLRYHY